MSRNANPPLALASIIRDSADVQGMVLESTTIWTPTSGGLKHWRSSQRFQTLDNGGVGISLDMFQPIEHEYQGSLPKNQYGSLNFNFNAQKLLSSRTLYAREVPFEKTITVADLYNMVCKYQLQYYTFHPDGSGCLYWQLNLLGIMETVGWVKKGARAKVEADIEKLASKDLNSIPWPPRQGTFYQGPN